jgi:hypothetical protein
MICVEKGVPCEKQTLVDKNTPWAEIYTVSIDAQLFLQRPRRSDHARLKNTETTALA